MELKDRLKIARKAKKLSQAEVAEHIEGLSQSAYSQLESGKSKTTTKGVELAELFGVSPAWLVTGQGEMTTTPTQRRFTPSESQLDGNYMVMEFWDSETPLDDEEFEVPYYKDVELLGGDGFDETDVSDDGRRKLRYAYTAARRAGASPKAVKCMTLKGDSMEELILDGSMIAVDTSKKEIREGKIYAFRHGNILRVKYLIPRPDGGLIIRSHNDNYADEVITGEQIEHENIQIIGWVWNWSSLLVW